ncbi:TFIIE beta subunit core domain protein, partial [Oesophagostomum dentatum]
SQQQWPLSLQEILDELQVYDLPKRSEAWLKEALPKNPRLNCDEESKFSYRPPYKIKGKTSLVAVAKKHHQDVKGGILLSELNDCIPNGEKVLEALADQIIVVPTQVNKRKDKVFFYNDQELDINIEDGELHSVDKFRLLDILLYVICLLEQVLQTVFFLSVRFALLLLLSHFFVL